MKLSEMYWSARRLLLSAHVERLASVPLVGAADPAGADGCGGRRVA